MGKTKNKQKVNNDLELSRKAIKEAVHQKYRKDPMDSKVDKFVACILMVLFLIGIGWVLYGAFGESWKGIVAGVIFLILFILGVRSL